MVQNLTMEELQDLGKSVQEEFNALTNLLESSVRKRMLAIGDTKLVTNVPIKSNKEFDSILENITILGLDVMKLKIKQRDVKCKELTLETEVDCLRVLLSNMKQLRLSLYRKIEEQQQLLEIESDIEFDLDEANKSITSYIKKLYTIIAEKRKDLAMIRETDVVEIDQSVLTVNELLTVELDASSEKNK